MGEDRKLQELMDKFHRYQALTQNTGLSVFYDLRNEAHAELIKHQTAHPTRHDLVKEPGWDPYCLMCETMGRMTRTGFGWKCEGRGDHFGRVGCGNTIGFDLCHYPPRVPPHTWRFTDPAFTQSFA